MIARPIPKMCIFVASQSMILTQWHEATKIFSSFVCAFVREFDDAVWTMTRLIRSGA